VKTQKEHWEDVYKTKSADAVSWFQAHAMQSMQLIKSVRAPSSAQIIDVGGGASTLVDDLLDAGFKNVSVLDLSAEALNLTQTRLGARGHSVEWIAGDIRYVELEDHRYDIWHDRAVQWIAGCSICAGTTSWRIWLPF